MYSLFLSTLYLTPLSCFHISPPSPPPLSLSPSFSSKVSILRRQISMMQLQRYCGLHGNLSLDKKRDLVLLCKHLYREGLKLATGVPETDTKPADFFVVLAVHLLIEIYVETSQ